MFLLRHLDIPLALNESYVLSDVSGHPRTSPIEVSKRLHIPKGTLSRNLRSLTKRRLLLLHADPTDGRAQQITITAQGHRCLHEDIAARNREMDLCAAPLNSQEREELVALMGALADGFGAPPLSPSYGEDPLLLVIRRHTRALGFQSEDVMGTGQPVAVCQALYLLSQGPEAVPTQTLRAILPYEPADLSRLLTRLTKDAIVCKEHAPKDRRQVSWRLTPHGRVSGAALKARAATRLEAGGMTLTELQRERLLTRIQQFVSVPLAVNESEEADWEFAFPAEGSETARRFLYEALHRSGEFDPVPPWLLAPGHIHAVAYHQKRLRGVAEVREEGDRITLLHLKCWPQTPSGYPARSLLGLALTAVSPEGQRLSMTPTQWATLFPQGAPWLTLGPDDSLSIRSARCVFPPPPTGGCQPS